VKRSAGHERGAVSIESVIIMPGVFLLMFTIFQAAAWLNARNIASQAADAGVAAARTENGTEGAGREAAMDVANKTRSLTSASVSITRDPEWVTVTVDGKAPMLLTNWGVFSIHQTASGPRERITDPGNP
jgi:Flp pilus assembly protein TadG